MTRPFTILTCAQRTPEWHAARAGRLTGSRAYAAFGTTKKGEWSANRKDLRVQLVLERITGQLQERAVGGYEVRDGIAREPLAKFHYQCLTGVLVTDCGFVSDTELPIGCSPDAVIGDFEGLVSAKCPKASTHLATLNAHRSWIYARETFHEEARITEHLRQVIPEEYRWQIRHEMYCTGASWCDYLSYHPAFPAGLQSVIVRLTREELDLPGYEPMVREFLADVDADYTRVLEMAS